ncbi:T6SS immunity protein Tli3 family protein [Pseudescherichia vulneris]|uniref:T6SS immunity protein Tli3 family protein n=1 Tax=Pseudescherichia vulneris TaxID=566 RepID=UPI0030C9B4ED
MPLNLTRLFIFLPIISAALLSLSGCVTEGAAFGLGAGSLHETVTTEKDKNAPPPVFGPPQIIYRIDDNRYFTLENYTRCEDGQTFYNNKKKGIHVKILDGSGYLFKGRLFWLSTRDDYLAFPATINTRHAACMGSDKGCMNAVIVTVDGGKTLNGAEYGGYTQDPTGDTEDYDMLVTNEGFYMINYWDGNRTPTNGSVDRWKFHPDEKATKERGYPGVSGPVYQREFEMDVSHVIQEKIVCNRAMEPVQPSGAKIR